jgi:NADH-quinone oxidoreductase subunit L
LRKTMPLTFWVYLIGALALAGIAPLAGFFSKDEIIAAAQKFNVGIFILLVLAAILTAFYMGRQISLVFFGKARTPEAAKASESKAIMTVPLVILAIFSILGGLINFPGVNTLQAWLQNTISVAKPEAFEAAISFGVLALALIALLVAWLIYGRRPLASAKADDPLHRSLGGLFTAFQRKWWVDEIYNFLFIQRYADLSNFFATPIDLGFIDGIVNGFGKVARWLAEQERKLQSGMVRSYALVVLVGVVVMLAYLVLR